ncbi:putative 60S ribosomal protein L23a 1 [Blattamonas nauphoetae]|uniref:60S ribosomal protein L23a 1 n=1 Tax=Blattamonas nauphoetae TaxID=2049346 RepID=A0ABQ9YIE6_9EUKA|nr:putative 60S ribosomal protein L23a 1 [Blattamonas nauphoetae]KAK2963364.1 putative 60S ribosomal protein L23a 1 [Blattamonas nauphoetae]
MVKQVRARKHKVRTSVHFHRPSTLELPRKPKFPRKAASGARPVDDFDIIRVPVTTESAMQQIENHNTLVFIVRLAATKPQIKRAFEKLYHVRCRKVNTLITPNGEKKAYIRLLPEHEALDVANQIGMV